MPDTSFTIAQLRRALNIIASGGDAAASKRLAAAAEEVKLENAGWLSSAGVIGLGIGRRVTGGETIGELVLTVFVQEKLPVDKLDFVIPPTIRIPGLDEPIRTDVEATGVIKPEANTQRIRPMQPGYSIAHPRARAGTLGCLVRDKATGEVYILSNSHVIANSGDARRGTMVVQPAVSDCGRTTRSRVAKLADWVPFRYSTSGYYNLVDAAIAGPVAASKVDSYVKDIGLPTGLASSIAIDDMVQKTGRTTNHTWGQVKQVDCMLALNLKRKNASGRHRVGFYGLVRCTDFTAGGDSGSAVLKKNRRVVGLHMAGNDGSSFFCPMKVVLAAFLDRGIDLEIVTSRMSQQRPRTQPC